jgi:hypothetical protein
VCKDALILALILPLCLRHSIDVWEKHSKEEKMKRIGTLLSLMLLAILPWSALACEPVAADKYYTVGDEVRIGDAVVQVHGIRYAESTWPKETVILIDVEVRNVGEDMFRINGAWDVDLYDQDGYKLRSAIYPQKRGDGLTTDLRPGRVIRGESVFRPEENSREYSFVYLYRYSEGLSHKGEVTFYLGSPDMSDEDRRAFIDAHNERFGH